MQRLEAFAWIATMDNLTKAGTLALIATAGFIGIIWLCGGVAATALVTALSFVGGMYLTANWLPKKMKTWLCDHPLFTNILATFITGFVIGISSVTGLLTTIFAALTIDIVQRIIRYVVLSRRERA